MIALILSILLSVQPPLVYVEWVDIVATDGGWHSEEELEEWLSEECVVKQTGFLYRETKDYIVLIDSYFDEENVGYAVKIPKGCIIKMVRK